MPVINDAPNTIPLWHFNETYGLWVQNGNATIVDGEYVFDVEHFSTWNLDIKYDALDAEITFIDENGNVVANQDVTICNENGVFLKQVYTDGNGQFTLLRAPENLIFKVVFDCKTVSYPQNVSGGNVTVTISLVNTLARNYTISGNISDCTEDGSEITYNDKYFLIKSNSNDIFFGGKTDDSGNYSFNSVLCDIDEVSSFDLLATVSLDLEAIKDTLITTQFTNNSQTIDINYCGQLEEEITDDYVIVFGDQVVEAQIIDNLNLANSFVTYGDVKEVTELSLRDSFINNSNAIISSIEGLQYFVSLENLFINSEGNINLSVISELTTLKTLRFHFVEIENVDAISELNNLEELTINFTQLSNISFVSNLTNLTSLNLADNQISDISPLSNLTNLTRLILPYNDIVSVNGLSNLTNLTGLHLSFNDIVSVNGLSNLTNLTTLDLNNNDIVSVNSLSNLTNLTNAWLSGNQIENLTPLCGLGNGSIAAIHLFNNPLTNTEVENLRSCLPNAHIFF